MLVNLVSGRFCHDVRRVRLGHSASRAEAIAKESKNASDRIQLLLSLTSVTGNSLTSRLVGT